MTNTNDVKILKLKEVIAKKKEALKDKKLFVPVTNCMLPKELGGNIRSFTKEKAINVLIELNIKLLSAKDLSLDDEYAIEGFLLSDWIKDLKSKLEEKKYLEEKGNLIKMESKLDSMLSESKQVELELDDIENMLK